MAQLVEVEKRDATTQIILNDPAVRTLCAAVLVLRIRSTGQCKGKDCSDHELHDKAPCWVDSVGETSFGWLSRLNSA